MLHRRRRMRPDPRLDLRAFYEQGWRGALIEPVPSLAAALRRRRPEDITIEAAAGATNGTATPVRLRARWEFHSRPMWPRGSPRPGANSRRRSFGSHHSTTCWTTQASRAGRSTSARSTWREARPRSSRLRPRTLAPVDPRRSRRPSPIDTVRATSRGRSECWSRLPILPVRRPQPVLRPLGQGRLRTAALLPSLRIRRGVQSRFFVVCRPPSGGARAGSHRDEATRPRNHELEEIAARVPLLERENAVLVATTGATAEVEAMRATISWRVTRPLRAARGMQRSLGWGQPSTHDGSPDGLIAGAVDRDLEPRVCPQARPGDRGALSLTRIVLQQKVDEALGTFEEALTSSSAPDRAKAWLSLVAVDGCSPKRRASNAWLAVLRMDGAKGVREELLDRLAQSVKKGLAATGELDVRRNRMIVDVTHTANCERPAYRHPAGRTGDSRHWIDSASDGSHPFRSSAASSSTPFDDECERISSWRKYVGSVGPAPSGVPTERRTHSCHGQCHLLVPELPFETERTEAYRGLGTASVSDRCRWSATTSFRSSPPRRSSHAVTTDFGGYLSVVKHANRVSTISRTSRDSFKAFATMAAAEGLHAPKVAGTSCPPRRRFDQRVAAVRSQLGIRDRAVVLVVGSHEPP